MLKQGSLRGEVYDLKEIYDRVNERYFEGKLALKICWVGNRQSMPRRKVMFGSYNQEKQLIKIHRRLDQSHVPSHFIDFIVYHEMLHHVLPPIRKLFRRRQIHHAAFRAREKQFEHYALVQQFRGELREVFFNRGWLRSRR